jgi:hypothetical protein
MKVLQPLPGESVRAWLTRLLAIDPDTLTQSALHAREACISYARFLVKLDSEVGPLQTPRCLPR